jgi:hypothetical protein
MVCWHTGWGSAGFGGKIARRAPVLATVRLVPVGF